MLPKFRKLKLVQRNPTNKKVSPGSKKKSGNNQKLVQTPGARIWQLGGIQYSTGAKKNFE